MPHQIKVKELLVKVTAETQRAHLQAFTSVRVLLYPPEGENKSDAFQHPYYLINTHLVTELTKFTFINDKFRTMV